jgi:hypothetical protein
MRSYQYWNSKVKIGELENELSIKRNGYLYVFVLAKK